MMMSFLRCAPGLRLERPVELSGGVQGEGVTRQDAAVVGDDRDTAVAIQHMHGFALESVAVLAENVSLRAVADDCFGRHDKHICVSLHGYVNMSTLSGPKTP